MYESNELIRKYPADFRVKYKFRSADEEGGRKTGQPYQGYRSDFSYADEQGTSKVYCINPEFENEKGELILENDKPVPREGTARMWVLFPIMREYHRKNLKVGMKCFFNEGSHLVADCEVIELLGLFTNPSEK